MRLFVSFLFGFIAEIATGLVIGVGMVATGAAMPTSPSEPFPAWVPIVAVLAGALFTFVIGYWRAVRAPDRKLLHALLVAVAAIMLHLATSLGAGQHLLLAHIVADASKLLAGAAAGLLATKRVAAAVH